MTFKAEGRSNPDLDEGEFRLLVDNHYFGKLHAGMARSERFMNGFNWELSWPDARRTVNSVEGSFLEVAKRILGDERKLDPSDLDVLSGLRFGLHTKDMKAYDFTFENRRGEQQVKSAENGLIFYNGTSQEVVQAYRKLLQTVRPDEIDQFEFYFRDFDCDSFRYPVGDRRVLCLELWGSQLFGQDWSAYVRGNEDFLPTASLLEWLVDNHVDKEKLVGNVDYDEATKTIQDRIQKTLSPNAITYLVVWDRARKPKGVTYISEELARPYSSCISLKDAREVMRFRAGEGQDCAIGEIVLDSKDQNHRFANGSSEKYLLVHEVTRWEYGGPDGEVHYHTAFVTPYSSFNELQHAMSTVQVPEGWESTTRVRGLKVVEDSGQQSLF
ncbi:hypothetical protein HYX12_02185 [Candidatus Woesearchaeota archaeon]|nr:hypothetical protein [Candidatus Woesearchaeota archaeon]